LEACAIFAEKGYRDTTVAEICERASANIASVNYHFGDKDHLYSEACFHAFELASEQYPIAGRLPETASPEEHIHAFVHALLQRIFDNGPAGWFPRIVVHEMTSPTPHFEHVFKRALEPSAARLSTHIASIVDVELSPIQLRLLALNVISQCLFFAVNRPVRERIMPKGFFSSQRIAGLARHITAFSMAGIEATAPRLAAAEDDS
jgi:AcrR family transcriptional regulator